MLKNPAKSRGPAVPCASVGTDIVKIIQSADFRKQMLDIGTEPVGNKLEEMARQIKEESEKFASVVKAARIVLD